MVPGMDVVVAPMYQPYDFAPEGKLRHGMAWSPFVALF